MAHSEAAATKPKKHDLAGTPAVSEASLKSLRQLAANRVAIEGVAPMIDGGRFAAKRVVGEVTGTPPGRAGTCEAPAWRPR